MPHGIPAHHERNIGAAHANLRVREDPMTARRQPAMQVFMLRDVGMAVIAHDPNT